MTLITILLVFLAGFSLASWGVPFLDNVFNTFAVWVQRLQGRMAVKITEDSVKAAKLKKEIEDEPESASTRVVGFAIPSKEKDEEGYEDDE